MTTFHFHHIANTEIYQGLLASSVANGIQTLNFLGDRFLRKSHASAGIDELYRHSVNSAFSPKEAFLVTGAPHTWPIIPATCLVLSRCSRSRDHHGFRGCRPPDWFARKKRPADAGGGSRQCRDDDHCSRGRRSVHRRQLLLAAVGYAVRHPRGSGTNHSRGPKAISVLGDGARRSCRPPVACRVSRGPEERDTSTRRCVAAVR